MPPFDHWTLNCSWCTVLCCMVTTALGTVHVVEVGVGFAMVLYKTLQSLAILLVLSGALVPSCGRYRSILVLFVFKDAVASCYLSSTIGF
jgi:hypothetical protein